MNKDIVAYNKLQEATNRDICDILAGEIQKFLDIQYNYKDIVKIRGQLDRLK